MVCSLALALECSGASTAPPALLTTSIYQKRLLSRLGYLPPGEYESHYNTIYQKRLLSRLGYLPPGEYESHYNTIAVVELPRRA
jgi:hypothetical protein